MASGHLVHGFQLKDHVTGASIIDAGGVAVVLTAGTPDKATLTDPDDAFVSLANPIALTRGAAKFAVVDTVLSVDIAVQAPGGQFLFLTGVKAQHKAEYAIDLGKSEQMYKIPFSHEDSTDAVEQDTGFDLPEKCIVLPHPFIDVIDVDATESIDVGLVTTDPNGFLAVALTSVAGIIKGTNLSAGQTLGALLVTIETSIDTHEAHVPGSATESISYTTTSGTDTAAGFIYLPLLLA